MKGTSKVKATRHKALNPKDRLVGWTHVACLGLWLGCRGPYSLGLGPPPDTERLTLVRYQRHPNSHAESMAIEVAEIHRYSEPPQSSPE